MGVNLLVRVSVMHATVYSWVCTYIHFFTTKASLLTLKVKHLVVLLAQCPCIIGG